MRMPAESRSRAVAVTADACLNPMPALPASSPAPSSAQPAALAGGRIALVCANRDTEAVRRAARAALAELQQASPSPGAVDTFEVGEVAEAPLLAKKLARSGRYRAIIACGLESSDTTAATGDGAPAVLQALRRVQCDTAVPVFPALLCAPPAPQPSAPRGVFADHLTQQAQLVAQDCLRCLQQPDGGEPAAPQAMG